MLSIGVTLFLCFVALVAAYVWYMSSKHGELKRKYGIDGPKTRPVIGNLRTSSFIDGSKDIYMKYKEQKVYATYFARTAALVVTDLDMIRDIVTRNFNQFPDRQEKQYMGGCMDSMLTSLTGERWKHVRSQLSPAFSSGKIKRMTKLIQKAAKMLTDNMIEKQEMNEEVELSKALSFFSMDVVATTAFAVELNSLKDPSHPFVTKAKTFIESFGKFIGFYLFAPFMFPVFRFLGIPIMDMSSMNFFTDFVERLMKERRSEVDSVKKNDFLQLMLEAEKENQENLKKEDEGTEKGGKKFHGLTDMEIQASALTFILGGYSNITTVMSFTLFLLAQNPDCLAKVQEELDSQLGNREPDYDSLANLAYLDMCINEVMRLYPPGFIIQRYCVEDTDVCGFTFPKGYGVNIPVYNIHHDPDLWEEPDKFDPERFSPERKEGRHQYSFMPFGYGPRNCIGMRLSQMEMKLGLASLLQKVTPVPCEKSVYPIKLHGFRLEAIDGLWVKFNRRTNNV